MSNSQSHTTCANPACHRPVTRSGAFLRSVSLVQVAFCSAACVEVFGQLDTAARSAVPAQRQSVDARIRR